MAQTNVSKLELNKYAPSWERVEACAGHLGVHPLTLFVLAYMDDISTAEMRKILKSVGSELGPVVRSVEVQLDEGGAL